MGWDWNVGKITLGSGDEMTELYSCPQCGALVRDIHRDGHEAWHERLRQDVTLSSLGM